MPFVAIDKVLEGKHEGKRVAIRGWVYRKRESKQTIFLLIRDSTGVVQCTVKADGKEWANAEKLTIESSLSLEGTVRLDERAPGGYEIAVDEISVIGLAEVFPISKDKSEEFLRDMRHLWLRSRKMNL
ncbi:MAG: OB-fold nucleic acid binding domain-containing protein, partial [Candidatus Bathyarchaeia archaeon]